MTTEVKTVASSQTFAPRTRGGVALRLTADGPIDIVISRGAFLSGHPVGR